DVAHGVLVLQPDGSFSYVHDGGESAADGFTYQASDGFGLSAVTTVAITVAPVNDAPEALPDAIAVDEGGIATMLVGGATSVLANDLDADGDALTAALVDDVAHGTLV